MAGRPGRARLGLVAARVEGSAAAPQEQPRDAPPSADLPPARSTLVVRERLVRVLRGADEIPLRIVVAPAGYGKTTVLRQWAEHDPRPFAWVTADHDHDDPVGLLVEIVRALAEIRPGGDEALTELMASPPTSATAVLPRLARALADPDRPFALVLDEVEALERPETIETLGLLSERLPAGSVLALASRSESGLPLGRFRVHQRIVELRSRDLAMTRGEARAMLSTAGLRLDGEQLDTLVRRTEGWPAGLYLAALALREQDDVAAAIARFSGDDRLVADYLRDELLSRLLPAEAAFLMRISPLEELSGPLCDAVLHEGGSGATLRDLARSSLPLSPLDRSDQRFRCHGLLAEMLRAELRRVEPEREAEVHHRASEWYDEHGDADRAIEHALAAGDEARAGELIWSVVPSYVAYGRSAAVTRWLERFTGEQLAHHPELALAAAAVHMTHGERDHVEHWAQIANARLDDVPADRRGDLEAGVAIMHAAVVRDGIAQMRADAARASALEPQESPWRALCCLLEGSADVFSGNPEAGLKRLEEGARRGAICAPSTQVVCLALLALAALMEDEWEDGARLAELARAQVERVGLREYVTCTLVFAASALARAHRGRGEEARRDVRDARRLLTRHGDCTPFFEGAATLALARAELRLGDPTSARTLLAECERSARESPDAVALRAWLEDAWNRADAFVEDAIAGPSSLTTAELRVLGLLPTHLPFRAIAAELHVSANTVKTQAHALYRKLDASSRSEAVAHATRLGLLDGG